MGDSGLIIPSYYLASNGRDISGVTGYISPCSSLILNCEDYSVMKYTIASDTNLFNDGSNVDISGSKPDNTSTILDHFAWHELYHGTKVRETEYTFDISEYSSLCFYGLVYCGYQNVVHFVNITLE